MMKSGDVGPVPGRLLEQFVDAFGPQPESFQFCPLKTALGNLVSPQQVDVRFVEIETSVFARKPNENQDVKLLRHELAILERDLPPPRGAGGPMQSLEC